MTRVDCPSCKTSYLPASLGISEKLTGTPLHATVVCAVCHTSFDVMITPEQTTVGKMAALFGRAPETLHRVETKVRARG